MLSVAKQEGQYTFTNFPANREKIPQELTGRDQWITWTLTGDGRKMPVSGTSNNPQTWTGFDGVSKADKIGFVFAEDDPYAGVDLDGCISEDGSVTAWAQPIMEQFSGVAYGEISPSGTGVKLWTRGKLNGRGCTKKVGEGKQQIERYEKGRYFAVTASVLPGYEAVGDGQEALDWLASQYFGFSDPLDSLDLAPRTTVTPVQQVAPEFAVKVLTPSAEQLARARAYCDGVPIPTDGERNNTVFKTAGHLKSMGLGVRATLDVMTPWADQIRPPLSPAEFEQAVRNGHTNGTPRDPKPPGKATPKRNADAVATVEITKEEHEVANQVVKGLGGLGWGESVAPESARVFVRGGTLVQVVAPDKPNGTPTIKPLPPAITRERIAQSCFLFEYVKGEDGQKEKQVRPPKWLTDAIHQRGYYGGDIRWLVGVVTSPTIRPDGTVLQSPGYDAATGLIYRPNADYPEISEAPSHEDAAEALQALQDVVVDFPFLDPADQSAWVAMVLAMIGRPSVDGRIPCFGITANIPGSGKSKLVDTASHIAYGHSANRKAFPRDEAELRKSITSILIEGTPSLLWDNLSVPLGGDALDAVLTSETWTDRVLGASKTTGELPVNTVWSTTGNNLRFRGDVARRVLPIRLQSPLEAPEERTGFRHVDLLSWVRKNRPRLAVAAITLMRAYQSAGCPDQPGGVWGGFEAFRDRIRGAIVWAGGADPHDTRGYAKGSDESATIHKLLIEGILSVDDHRKGITTAEIKKLFVYRADDFPELHQACVMICGDEFNSRKVGNRIASFAERVSGEHMIKAGDARGSVKSWRVVRST